MKDWNVKNKNKPKKLAESVIEFLKASLNNIKLNTIKKKMYKYYHINPQHCCNVKKKTHTQHGKFETKDNGKYLQ